jgi:O-antigen/teichoic acid export membrane protein
VIQASSSGVFQVGLGLLGAREIGLIIGTLAGQVASVSVLTRTLKLRAPKVRLKQIFAEAVRYRHFPFFSLPADFINAVANQLPLFILTAKFGMEVGGFFGLTQRVLGLPVNLLAGSIADVFKNAAAAEFKRSGNCRRIYLKTFGALFFASILPFSFFAVFAPWLFSVVFGHEWAEAGEYARILALFYFFRFTASPLSYVMYIAEKQAVDLCWQAGLFGAIFLAMTLGSPADPRACLIRFSLAYSAMYVVYLFISYRFACGKK